jgi:hypothetical protein
MGHKPTIFYILENQTLGSWWIGKMESTLDGYGMPPCRSITQDQLNDKLSEKYHNPNAYLTLVTLNKRWSACYGVERWLSKLEYKINKEPEKYHELEKLLKAGWDDDIETSTLSVLHVLEHNQPINKIFKKLVTSREGLTRCLNTNKYKTYEDKKKDPDFLKAIGRKKVLRQMEKTKKLPKPETLEKYEIKEDCYINYMEEIPCEPCEKKFYKKGKYWYCLCDKRTDTCSNPECKEEGLNLGLKVGGAICEHNKYRSVCKECGVGICKHNRVRSVCKDCGGGTICEHNRARSKCKECGGGSICEHNKERSVCKDCGGSQICKHSKIRSRCKECGGSQICEHNTIRYQCKKCEGSQICEHDRIRSICKDCGGGAICEHDRIRSICKYCKGGSICEHNKERSECKECGGSRFCEHNIQRRTCKICDPHGHIASLRRSRRRCAIKTLNPTHTLDDLCMTTREWLKYLYKTFEDRYGRPKTEEDEVHIDEIIPCSAWDLPDDNKYCWHYLNSQWLLAEDNLSKSDSYEEKDKLTMIERIQSS